MLDSDQVAQNVGALMENQAFVSSNGLAGLAHPFFCQSSALSVSS
jgi:hypothetical protein